MILIVDENSSASWLSQFNISGLVLMAEIHGNDLLTQREEINLMKKTVEDHAQRIEDLEELEKLDRKLRQEQENRINQLLDSTADLASRMTATERNAAGKLVMKSTILILILAA